MTTAMSGSLVVLFWSFVQLSLKSVESRALCWAETPAVRMPQYPRLLLVVQTTIALSLTQILAGFFKNADVPAPCLTIHALRGITRLRVNTQHPSFLVSLLYLFVKFVMPLDWTPGSAGTRCLCIAK